MCPTTFAQTKYGFYTALSNNGPGYICIRIDRWNRESNIKTHKASFAFCSPLDAIKYSNGRNLKQCRLLSKRIADSRMNTKRVKAFVEFDFEGTINEAFQTALILAKNTPRHSKKNNHFKNPTIAPSWVLSAEKIIPGIPCNTKEVSVNAETARAPAAGRDRLVIQAHMDELRDMRVIGELNGDDSLIETADERLAQLQSELDALCQDKVVEIDVQVNGKVRGRVSRSREATEAEVREAALADDNVRRFVDGKTLRKVVYVPGRIINFIG